jgi:hypothetical protein
VQYLLLIHDDPEAWARMAPEESSRMMKEYFEYSTWLEEKGWFQGGNALQPDAIGTTVRVRDGERVVTDGPFAETKEQLGGYYLIEVPSMDEALEAAERIPSARIGTIEIRPVMELTDESAAAGAAAEAQG